MFLFGWYFNVFFSWFPFHFSESYRIVHVRMIRSSREQVTFHWTIVCAALEKRESKTATTNDDKSSESVKSQRNYFNWVAHKNFRSRAWIVQENSSSTTSAALRSAISRNKPIWFLRRKIKIKWAHTIRFVCVHAKCIGLQISTLATTKNPSGQPNNNWPLEQLRTHKLTGLEFRLNGQNDQPNENNGAW